jgi:hypothetical protein
MQMTQNLGMYEELYPGAPGLGHIPRATKPTDMTDGGIVDRIKKAVSMGYISPEAAAYLVENLLEDDAMTQQAVRGMPGPRAMPLLNQTFPHSLNNGLLSGE